MLSSERRSLFRFLSIYLGSTLILFFLATAILYHYQKHNIIDNQLSKLHIQAQNITQKLRELHATFNNPLIYPLDKSYDSAIFDINREYIFGTFKPKDILWNKNFYTKDGYLYYIYSIKPYYLGASYLVISNLINQQPIIHLKKILALFLFIAFILFTI